MIEYENVTLVIDDALIDAGDSYAVIEPVWWSVSIYDGLEIYTRDLLRFSKPQRHVFAITWYRSEVDNGGHHQFYLNSTGMVWADALEAFEAMNFAEGAAILRESFLVLGGQPFHDYDKRAAQIDLVEHGAFETIDDRFYDAEADMDEHVLAYMKQHRSDFYFSGMVRRPKRRSTEI